MPGFFVRLAISAIGLWLASILIPSIQFDGLTSLLVAALLLGIVNGFVRPLAVFFTLPLTLVTLGFFLLVINAGMLGLVAYLLPGFTLGGFWPAFFGSIVVSLTSWAASGYIGPDGRFEILVVERRS